ncbi:MAG: hypothetical protein ACD_62C00045G0004 [uncultured bacterium]|nr:MAG: hypothetical protein ACD_62C00045G0004 [uncultured bacterium]
MNTNEKTHVLVIDDEKPVCITCQRILEEEGFDVTFVLSGKDGIEKAIAGNFQVILLDLKMPGLSGMETMAHIQQERPDIEIIIITGYATIQTSIEAIKEGAFDYIPKPFTPDELLNSVRKALHNRQLKNNPTYSDQDVQSAMQASRVVGRSQAMQNVFQQILKVALTDFTVMVYGESGTGKELIAKAIGQYSQRATKPFVGVDVSAIAPTIVESELFGHVRGAFTGATSNRTGYFSTANGGTLFLDEISNISLELQGKLLRALETKHIQPVGSDKPCQIDIRLITATNKDLSLLVKENKFREDLYYRINVIPITIPSLRERAEDIPLLATHFLNNAKSKTQSEIKGFTTAAMAKMLAYPWPGNVRELKNVIERLVGTTTTNLIGVEHLPTPIAALPPQIQPADHDPASPLTIPETAKELRKAKKMLKDKFYGELEKNFVLQVLKKSNGNITHAARLAGMQRPNFHALMRKHNITNK